MLTDHDVVLLCSDGLTRMVPDSEIASTLRKFSEPQISADTLVLLANQYGGTDNFSVVVLPIMGVS